MVANVGTTDRIIRVVVGLALLSLLYFVSGPAHWFGLLGLVALVTATFSYCPAYRLIGLSTCNETNIVMEKTAKPDGCGSGGCGCGR